MPFPQVPWESIRPRHVLAALMGLALFIMPLYILSFDPESGLQRLQTPLCRGRIDVATTNQNGGAELLRPDSGVKMFATVEGTPYPVKFTIFDRETGGDWSYRWELAAPEGREIYYVSPVHPGMSLYVKAIDPTGARCPSDGPVLRAGDS